jgi:hypothetical protein
MPDNTRRIPEDGHVSAEASYQRLRELSVGFEQSIVQINLAGQTAVRNLRAYLDQPQISEPKAE